MDQRATNHLALALGHGIDLMLRTFELDLRQHYAACGRDGTLGSGYRITQAIVLIDQALSGYSDFAFNKALEISSEHKAFVIAAVHVQRAATTFESMLPKIVWFPKGTPDPKNAAAFDSARLLLNQVRSDVAVELRLKEFSFDPAIAAVSLAVASAPKSKGGRPPKPHEAVLETVKNRLLAYSDSEFARCTVESVVEMMSEEYVRLGKTPYADKKRASRLLKELRSASKGQNSSA